MDFKITFEFRVTGFDLIDDVVDLLVGFVVEVIDLERVLDFVGDDFVAFDLLDFFVDALDFDFDFDLDFDFGCVVDCGGGGAPALLEALARVSPTLSLRVRSGSSSKSSLLSLSVCNNGTA